MINEFEFYHGAALCKIVHSNKLKSIDIYPTSSNSSYIVNGNIGLFIKYSTKRLTPWRFSFKKDHQDEIENMNKILKVVYILFVCRDDGIACLSFEELKRILNEEHKDIEWVSANRKKREHYEVSGSDGKLKFKIGPGEFPKKIFDH